MIQQELEAIHSLARIFSEQARGQLTDYVHTPRGLYRVRIEIEPVSPRELSDEHI